jgi:hypothetical protein
MCLRLSDNDPTYSEKDKPSHNDQLKTMSLEKVDSRSPRQKTGVIWRERPRPTVGRVDGDPAGNRGEQECRDSRDQKLYGTLHYI